MSESAATKKPPTDPTPKGAGLVFDVTGAKGGVTARRWYWVGAYPTSPTTSMNIGGTSFPMATQIVHEREGSEPSQREGRLGHLVHLSKAQIENIKESLSRSVIRFLDPPDHTNYEGQGIELVPKRVKRGKPIRVMTQAEIELRRKNEIPVPEYTPEDHDEPMAHHVFAQLCQSQDNPRCGAEYPPPLSETGLEWGE